MRAASAHACGVVDELLRVGPTAAGADPHPGLLAVDRFLDQLCLGATFSTVDIPLRNAGQRACPTGAALTASGSETRLQLAESHLTGPPFRQIVTRIERLA